MAGELQTRIARLEDATIRRGLTDAIAARGEASPIVVAAVGLAERVAVVSPRERATTPASLAAAVRDAVSRLDESDQTRVRARPKPVGLVIANPERLALLAEIAVRRALLDAPSSTVDASIIEEGRQIWLRVRTRQPVRGWPSTPTSRVYGALLAQLCERIEGDVILEENLVEIRLERAPFD